MSVALSWSPVCLKVCLFNGLVFRGRVTYGRQVVGSLFGLHRVGRRPRQPLLTFLVDSVVVCQNQAELRFLETLHFISLEFIEVCSHGILNQTLAQRIFLIRR